MNNQRSLFGEDENKPQKTYRAIRHDVVRKRQSENCPTAHHPDRKKSQIARILDGRTGLKILELFAGQGNLTGEYEKHGHVTKLDKKIGTGDSFLEYHRMIADRKKYDVVDADPYGFPSRLFPDIFLLIDNGFFFCTLPIASINILHDITKTHLYAYFGNESPSEEEMTEAIVNYGLCHWRMVTLVDSIKIDRLHRMVFEVKRVKATEYTGVRNR